MPELPEIESIRLYLDSHIIGNIISRIEILEYKQFVGDPKSITGWKIKDISRTGKVLHIAVTDEKETKYLNFHLKLSGQILFAPDSQKAIFKNIIPLSGTNKMPSKMTRIIIHFKDGSALYFNDMRKFGWIKLTDKKETPKAIDVLSKEFTFEYFKKSILGTRRAIKVVIMDQDRMAGVGNIYANDALWEAHIMPDRPANSLTDAEQKILYESILKTITEGIKYKGSSAKDELYVLPDSEKGSYQNHFKTYHQYGKPCKRCGTILKRMTLGGRGTFFCPNCQK